MARPRLPLGTAGEIGTQEVDGRWRARVQYRDWTGQIKQVSRWGTTKGHARSRLRLALRDIQSAGQGDIGHHTTTTELVNLWLVHAASERRSDGALARTQQTVDRYRDVARNHIEPGVGEVRLGEATTGNIERALQALAKKHPTQAKHSRHILLAAYDFAVRCDAIPRNPVTATSPIRVARKDPQALAMRQIALLRAATRAWLHRERTSGPKASTAMPDAVDIMVASGCRIGEILGLRAGDIDLENGLLTVAGTVAYNKELKSHWAQPKSKTSKRRLELPAFAVEIFRRRMEGLGPDEYIFSTRTGKFMTPSQMRIQLRDALKQAGLEKEGMHPHAIRRSVATYLTRAPEHGLDDASSQLGHSSTAVTKRHYVEPEVVHDGPEVAEILNTWVQQADAELGDRDG